MKQTAEFINALQLHTRINERAIGITDESSLSAALREAVRNAVMLGMVKQQTAAQIKASIDMATKKLKMLIEGAQSAENKESLLREAVEIESMIALGVAMLEKME